MPDSDQKHKEIMKALEKQDEVLRNISLRQDDHEKRQNDHEKIDKERFDQIPVKPTEEEVLRQKQEFEESVERVMKKVLFSGSKWTYRAIIVVAILFGSIITIGGGLKWLLALIGFTRS